MWLEAGVFVAFLAVVVCIILGRKRSKEGFATAFRHGWLCQPLINNDQDDILPTNVTFVVEGYNYQETPIIYRDGKKVVPLQFSWDYTSMAYYFVMAAPKGAANHKWMLETFDFVEPRVTEGRSLEPVKVKLLRRRFGFNHWELVVWLGFSSQEEKKGGKTPKKKKSINNGWHVERYSCKYTR
jgi:hypothetical protein